jgi:hypothetical protein
MFTFFWGLPTVEAAHAVAVPPVSEDFFVAAVD